MANLRVVARITARPETVGQVRELLTRFIDPTRSESGCIAYELLQNTQDPTDFTFVEEWTDNAALDAHLASPHMARGLPTLLQLVAQPPDIRRYSVVA